MDLHSTSYMYSLLFSPPILARLITPHAVFAAIPVLAAKSSRCLPYAFPVANQNPRYLKLSTTSISFPLIHHLSFLLLLPLFLNTIIFVLSVLICKSKKCGTLHDFACHPCAGAMLIFSVSFQF